MFTFTFIQSSFIEEYKKQIQKHYYSFIAYFVFIFSVFVLILGEM